MALSSTTATATTPTSPVPSSTSIATASATANASTTPIDNTPPPTYTITIPTPAPTVTRPPDTNYNDQALETARIALLSEINALPILTGTITGTLVSGLTGGRVRSQDGGLTLGIRPGVVPLTDTILVQVNRVTLPPGDARSHRNGHQLGYTYELTATRSVGGQSQPIERFAKDVVLLWDLPTLNSAGVSGWPLDVYTFDETSQSWQPVPTDWEPQTDQLVATTPHFSLWAVDPPYDRVKNYVPSVDNFEVDLQTGTANIEYPINLPPGPGGFGPKVSLSYNSGNVDRVDVRQQGTSNVGWGWSLSSSYIAATKQSWESDPTYQPWTASIVVDGINGDLVLGRDLYWHTSNEGFARVQYITGTVGITRTTDSWVAWDKSGTKYEFDLNALVTDDVNPPTGRTTYKWMLHRATDVHSNTITYSYKWQDSTTTLKDQEPTEINPTNPDKTRAVYPYQIVYGAAGDGPGGEKVRVTFDVVPRAIGDYDDISEKDIESDVYQSYRINKITVERKQQGSGQYKTLRTYELDQNYSIQLPEPTPRPTDTSTPTPTPVMRPHLTLSGITPKGKPDDTTGQQQQLPKTTFDYISPATCPASGVDRYDRGKICSAKNGYGGSVGYYYDAAGGDAAGAYRRVRAKRVYDGIDAPPPGPGQSNPHNALYQYEQIGSMTNIREISEEADPGYDFPLHKEATRFRGFGWVRVFDPMGQVTDHYYSQTDDLKGKEWRTQMGKANTFTDYMDATPTTNADWTVTQDVTLRLDPSPTASPSTTPTPTPNYVWKLQPPSGNPNATPYVERKSGVTDGSDVTVRFMLFNGQPEPPPSTSHMEAIWKLQNDSGDYWGLVMYPRDTGKGTYLHYPKLVWSVNGTPGERDLSTYFPLRPQWSSEGFRVGYWYRLRLHTSPDGRFALQLYFDKTDLEPYKDYIQIKSGDRYDPNNPGLLIPKLPTGRTWKFKHQVIQEVGGEYATLVDEYQEWRTLYTQSDSTYENRTPFEKTAQSFNDEPLVGRANNAHAMNIRFVPVVETQAMKYGEGSQVGQSKRSKQTFEYDAYGNRTRANDFGDAADGAQGDERSTISSFAVLSTTQQYIVDKVGQTLTYQGITSTVLMAETQYFYDSNQNYGEILPGGKGNLTQLKQVGVVNGVRTPPHASQFFHYDQWGNRDQVTDPNGITTTTQFDPYYRAFPISITHPNGRTETTGYDFTLDVASVMTDMNGMVTRQEHDTFGRPSKSWVLGEGDATNPNERYIFPDIDQQVVTPTLNLYIQYQKRLDASTNEYGWQTRWFDGRGRILEDVYPKDRTTNQVVVAANTYTVTGVLSSTTMPYLATASPTQYVPFDYSKPKTVQYQDGAGRPSMVVNPDGSQIIYDYSLLLWTGVRDEEGRQKWQRTDMLGRTDLVMEQACPPCAGFHIDPKVAYQYDMLDRLTQVTRDPDATTSAGAVITTIKYDGLGRKSQMQDPDMGEWQYEYDLAGNMTVQRDALYLKDPSANASHQIFFRYDGMNRITGKYYGADHNTNNIADVKYYYDNDLGDAAAKYSWGRLRRVNVTVEGQGQERANGHAYEYDLRGRPVADVVTTTNYYNTLPEYVVRYTYDVGGRMRTVTYPDPDPDPQVTPETVSIGYNLQGMGLPQSLTSNVSGNPNPVYSAQYNERSQLTQLQQGSAPQNNLLTTAYQYNVRGWLTQTLATTSNATLLNLSMSFYLNGNVSSISNQNITNPSSSNPTFTNTFQYDWLNRLSSASSTSAQVGSLFPTEQYEFDNLSRMTTRTIGGTQQTYAYNDAAHKDAPTSYNGNTYSYDQAGNQTSRTQNGVTQSRTFDAENRMVGLDETRADLSRTTDDYVYDGNGKRLIKVSNERGPGGTPLVTTRTLYIGSLYEEEIPNGQNARAYIVYYMLGQKLVGLRRANWQGQSNGQFRVVGDHLGSTTLIVDTSAPPQVVQRQYYKPYGEVALSWGSSRTNIGYTGQRLDGESGLMYYGARYYDPVLSFFAQADPTVPDASELEDYNKYLYVRGNPLRYIDTSGYGPNDYYVFVEGCVFNPCKEDVPITDFGEYMEILRELYIKEGWGYAAGDKYVAFADWAKTHVYTANASSLDDAAARINDILTNKIPKDSNSNIHLLGTSQGGAAIMQYLADTYGSNAKYKLDPRIASVTTIDSPLNDVKRMPPNMGAYLAANTRVKTGVTNYTALTVDAPSSLVEADPVAGIPNNDSPNYTYPQPKILGIQFTSCINICRHTFVTGHAFPDTKAFLLRVWK